MEIKESAESGALVKVAALLVAFLFYPLVVICQTDRLVDQVIGHIYNCQFAEVPPLISRLRTADPELASYLDFDLRWWKMIALGTPEAEREFVAYKKAFGDSLLPHDDEFRKIVYHLYQVRYENMGHNTVSKYMSAVKGQIWFSGLDSLRARSLKPDQQFFYRLIVEFHRCVKYRFLGNMGVQATRNQQLYESTTGRIEQMKYPEYRTFESVRDYFLGKIYLEIGKDTAKAVQKFSDLSMAYPGNPVFRQIFKECKIAR